MLPEELTNKKQWTYSYSRKELKRPKDSRYIPDGALDYSSALDKAGESLLVGFYTTREDPYVLIDIDHTTQLSELPEDLTKLMSIAPTYTEVSPSGNGLRIIYKLSNAGEKDKLEGNSFYAKRKFKDDKRNIQLNIDKPWMTITGNATILSKDKVAIVSLDILKKVFNFERSKPKLELVGKKNQPLPAISAVVAAINLIPLDQNMRVKRNFEDLTGNEYHHYDFWLKILMSLHDYATKSDNLLPCLDVAISWSQTDPDSFQSQKDIIDKWKSFSDKPLGISYRTIFKLANMNTIQWPKPRKITAAQKRMGLRPKPFIMSIHNFQCLLDFYNIKLNLDVWDPNIFYLTGDKDILDKYFHSKSRRWYFQDYLGPFDIKSFAAIANPFMESHQFDGIGLSKIRDFVESTVRTNAKTVNFFHLYMNTPFKELPLEAQDNSENHATSNFDALWSCLTINSDKEEDIALYKTYYRKWFLNLLRNLMLPESEYSMNIGILILTGPEQIRKTTHFACLLPKIFRDKVIFTTHGFGNTGGMRDITKISSTSFIVIWDEFEQYLTPETESNFKKLMDANKQTFIDKYEVSSSVFKPISVYGATSNMERFKLKGLTSRRFLHIPVSWVDTDKMMSLCWHPILQELLDSIKNSEEKAPWLLTEEELDHQALLHQNLSAKTEIEFELLNIFDFDNTFIPLEYHLDLSGLEKSGMFMRVNTVRLLLMQNSPNSYKLSAIRHALTKLCSIYTNTVRHDRIIKNPLKHLRIHQGYYMYGNGKFYVMPPRKKQDDPFE